MYVAFLGPSVILETPSLLYESSVWFSFSGCVNNRQFKHWKYYGNFLQFQLHVHSHQCKCCYRTRWCEKHPTIFRASLMWIGLLVGSTHTWSHNTLAGQDLYNVAIDVFQYVPPWKHIIKKPNFKLLGKQLWFTPISVSRILSGWDGVS